ncbi:MAG TPA: Uma2 family endonuclease [Urbifossiella sp.]|nr:Uma2 family endonuclease [Urbifossiella sp.]
MTALPKAKLTVAEYLAIERRAEFKSEFHDGEMFAMAGASREHNTVAKNLGGELYGRLKGGPCQTFLSDQRVRIARTGLYCYPDLVIVCGEPQYAEEDRDTLVNPRVVFEVLSPSTERYDRTVKLRHYKQLPSVQEYVLVAQDQAWCERYARQADGAWTHVEFVGLDATLELTSVPVAVPLADVYARVTFPPDEVVE